VQKQHDLANDLLLGPAADDPLGAFGADSGDFSQATRLRPDRPRPRSSLSPV